MHAVCIHDGWWFVNPVKHPEVQSLADFAKASGPIRFTTGTSSAGADLEARLPLDRYGIARKRVEWVSIPDIQAIQSLKQGLVDISGVHPPSYKAMAEAGARKIADSSETGLGAAGGITYWTFHDDYLRTHPEQAAAFIRALRKAQVWGNAHPVEALQLTTEAVGAPVSAIHHFSERAVIEDRLAEPWLADLEAVALIPKGRLTAAALFTHALDPMLVH